MDFFRRQRNSRFTERRETAENILRKTELKKSRTDTEKKYRRENRKKNRQTRERGTRDERNAATPCYCARTSKTKYRRRKRGRTLNEEGKLAEKKRDRARTHTRIGARFSRYYLRRTCNDCTRLHVRNRIIEGIPSAGIPSRRENKSIRRIRRSNDDDDDGVRNIAYATRKRIR